MDTGEPVGVPAGVPAGVPTGVPPVGQPAAKPRKTTAPSAKDRISVLESQLSVANTRITHLEADLSSAK